MARHFPQVEEAVHRTSRIAEDWQTALIAFPSVCYALLPAWLWASGKLEAAIAALAGLLVIAWLVVLARYGARRRQRQADEILRLEQGIDALKQLPQWIRHEYANSAVRMGTHRQLAVFDTGGLSETGQMALEAIERETKSMMDLADAVVRLTRARMLGLGIGGEHWEPRAINLSARADEAIDLIERKALDKEIALSPRLKPACIQGDDAMIVMMLINLIENAVKYTPPGGKVEVHCRHEDQRVTLAILDDGPGIPEAMREIIFLPGQRLSETESERGSGFGLALVREIVRLHNGDIAVGRSILGGAAFELNFPAAQ